MKMENPKPIPKFKVGQKIKWLDNTGVIMEIEEDNGIIYLISWTPFKLTARIPEELITSKPNKIKEKGPNGLTELYPVILPKDPIMFNHRRPSLLVVDNFYKDPDYVRKLALVQKYGQNKKYYKGKRTGDKFLFPGVKEQFEKLLGVTIKDWLNMDTNGVFQITKYDDPLVWHHDLQDYAAAIYLTPNAPPSAGTSFWREKTYGTRRQPSHPLELERLGDDYEKAAKIVYDEYNLVHGDTWELVDKVGSVYNRLAIWDAKMIHSASSYESFTKQDGSEVENSRLVQLFFFNIVS